MNLEIIEKLKTLGLNHLEAEVYELLLREEAMTAYKVGKMLKKPTANIYKAVEVLAQKGAIMIAEGKNKLVKAVAPNEFIASLSGEYALKLKDASQALASIKPQPKEEHTYSLESVSLALEKAKKMIEEAEVVVVIDAFPISLGLMKESLEQAAQRGVKVFVQAYEELEIEGADVTASHLNDKITRYWKSEQLNVIADGRESLTALFDRKLEKVYHATWSTNVYLSCILHAGRKHEQTVHKLLNVKNSPQKLQEIEAILTEQQFFHNSQVPGVQELFSRYLTEIPPSS